MVHKINFGVLILKTIKRTNTETKSVFVAYGLGKMLKSDLLGLFSICIYEKHHMSKT